MRVTTVEFAGSAARADRPPGVRRPEVAFLGPSNVGKSSLVNALLGRKGLARVSRTPGRTQLLNYFAVNDEVYFVDLPGYGFARVPRAVQGRFLRLVEEYLSTSTALALLVLLLDCRREPSARDLELRTWLEEQDVPHAIVLTKADKLPRGRLARQVKAVEKALGLDRIGAAVLPFSAVSGQGKRELWAVIDDAVAEARGGFEGSAPGDLV